MLKPVQLLRSTLSLLVALDNDEDILTFHQPFRTAEVITTAHTVVLFIFVLSFGILQTLIRHASLRVLGTQLILACIKDDRIRSKDTDDDGDLSNTQTEVRTNILACLRPSSLSQLPLRQSLICAIEYTIASEGCIYLASWILPTEPWLSLSKVIVALLLEGMHMRWTHSIILNSPAEGRGFKFPWRTLLLPVFVHATAQITTAAVPSMLGDWVDAMAVEGANSTAARDVVSLASALFVRFLILYPSYASLIAYEASCLPKFGKKALFAMGNALGSRDLSLRGYRELLRLCYQKVLLRLTGLHLQTAGVLFAVELMAYILFHALV